MKYNTTYSQSIGLKETIIETESIMHEIRKIYKSKFNLLTLNSPVFLKEDDPMLIKMDEKTRTISFDTAEDFRVMQLPLTNSNWLRHMVSKLDLEDNEGLISYSSYVWRDLVETPVASPAKYELTIQIKNTISESEKDEFLKKLTDDLYEVIYEYSKKIETKYPLIKPLPEFASIVKPQQMENEMPNSSRKEREEEFGNELHAFIFKNPSLKMHSGHFHTHIPSETYNLSRFNQIVIRNSSNSSVLKVASISELAMGTKLADQLSYYNKSELKQFDYYAEQIKKQYNIFEIKINIGRLVLALLDKGHISEVQPSVETDEKSRIVSRYKIDTY